MSGRPGVLLSSKVAALVTMWGFSKPCNPVYQDFGYDAAFCHVSAKHRAMNNGGRRMHGWAVWEFDEYAIAEFHSVWQTDSGELIDVTPPKFGNRILFYPDTREIIEEENGGFRIPTDRTSDNSQPMMFQGKATDYTHWSLPKNTTHFVQYCQKWAIAVSDMKTDAQFG